MTQRELLLMLPELFVAGATLLVVLAIAVRRSHAVTMFLTIAGLSAALVVSVHGLHNQDAQVTLLFSADRFTRIITLAITSASIVVAFLAGDYFRLRRDTREEFYVVLLLATLGSMVLSGANHFASLFLGLEVLSVSLYVMIAYLRDSMKSLEAGVKYLLLAAASSAFLVFGIAMIYLWGGTLEFKMIAERLSVSGPDGLFLAGTALVVVGAGYKLALVPFHMWTPDIYEGAPAPATAFIATVPKGATIALLLRFFVESGAVGIRAAGVMLAVLAIASMVAGNFLALRQSNVKRLLAYSSIAHVGYMFVAFVAGGSQGVESITYYIFAYFVTSLGAFGIVSLLNKEGDERVMLAEYRGLFWQRPWAALVFTAMLLSLAGIPLTAGFVGKFLVLAASIGAELWTLSILLVVNSAISLYYYLSVIVVMFSRGEKEEAYPAVGQAGNALLAMLLVVLLVLGMYPGPLLVVLRDVVASVL